MRHDPHLTPPPWRDSFDGEVVFFENTVLQHPPHPKNHEKEVKTEKDESTVKSGSFHEIRMCFETIAGKHGFFFFCGFAVGSL